MSYSRRTRVQFPCLKIYCLIRPLRSSPESRLASSLAVHRLPHLISSPKLFPLASSLSEDNFGLLASTYNEVGQEATHIIHCVWVVNFSIPLSSFAPRFLGLQNLLSLSQSAQAYFVFCSSIAAALGTASPAVIPCEALDSLTQASATGYGKSKLVAEIIVQNAVERYAIYGTILRIGQIVPTRQAGRNKVWNPTEMIPLVVRSANVVGCLPDRMGSAGGEECEWLEVDVVSRAVLDVCGFGSGQIRGKRLAYNIVHPKSFSWTDDFLPLLSDAGIQFENVAYPKWLEKLRNSEVDVEINPSRKLLEFWGKQNEGAQGRGSIRFDTKPAEEISFSLRTAPKVVDGGLVKELVDCWR